MGVKQEETLTALDLLARFLNCGFEPSGKAALKDPAVRLLVRRSCTSDLRKGLQEAKRVQEEVISDVSPLIVGERTKDTHDNAQGHKRKLLAHLSTVVKKINDMQLKTEWVVAFGDQEIRLRNEEGQLSSFRSFKSQNPFLLGPPPLGPNQKVLKIGNTKWIVYKRPYDEGSLRRWMYGILVFTFESGEFTKLRRCRECRKFFIAEDARREFCGNRCKDTFHNRRRKAEGYHMGYRRAVRRQKVAKARKLQENGKSFYQIVEETGLSRRVLEKVGLRFESTDREGRR